MTKKKTPVELAEEWGKQFESLAHREGEDDQSLKADAGKPLAGCLLEFPTALAALADVSTYGVAKYGRGSWQQVHIQRYIDAMMRHVIAMGDDCMALDEQSDLPHLAHVLWNACAIIELTDWDAR